VSAFIWKTEDCTVTGCPLSNEKNLMHLKISPLRRIYIKKKIQNQIFNNDCSIGEEKQSDEYLINYSVYLFMRV